MQAAVDQDDVKWYNTHYGKLCKSKYLSSWHLACVLHLKKILTSESRLLEVACGQSPVLQHLVGEESFSSEKICGLDQSDAAVSYLRTRIPDADLSTGDAYHLPYDDEAFDVVVLLEAIEHFRFPGVALGEISRVLKPGGHFLISFPNYSHLPWLIVRILAEKWKRPSWINLQPVDHIFFYSTIRSLLGSHSFEFVDDLGSVFFPPVLYKLESGWMTRLLNVLGLARFSFHPVLLFEKFEQKPAP